MNPKINWPKFWEEFYKEECEFHWNYAAACHVLRQKMEILIEKQLRENNETKD